MDLTFENVSFGRGNDTLDYRGLFRNVQGDLTFNDCLFERLYRHSDHFFEDCNINNLTFNRCKFANNRRDSQPMAIRGTNTIFNYCFMRDQSFALDNIATFNNCNIFGIYALTSNAHTFNNSIVWQDVHASSVLNNCVTRNNTIGGTQNNCVLWSDGNYDLKFVNPVDKLDGWGGYIIRIDDPGNIAYAEAFANLANPLGIYITFAMNIHGQLNKPSAADIAAMRRLKKGGNDVVMHGSVHYKHGQTSTCLSISATGTSPSLDVVVTSRSGDSTTWDVDFEITINGETETVSLDSGNVGGLYTQQKLAEYLDGLSVGDGTVTCTASSDYWEDQLPAMVLSAQSSLDISATQSLAMDNDAIYRVELGECYLDLKNYVLTGYDRNSANGYPAEQIGETPPALYDPKVWVAAGGGGSAEAKDYLQSIGVIGGILIGGANPTFYSIFPQIGGGDLFTIPTIQLGPATMSPFFGCAEGVFGFEQGTPVWHGRASALEDTEAGTLALIDTLLSFGAGKHTLTSAIQAMIDNDKISITGGVATVTEPVFGVDYGLGDFTPQSDSPLIDAGKDIDGITYPTTDLAGRTVVSGRVDIGAYQSQVPAASGDVGFLHGLICKSPSLRSVGLRGLAS